MLHDFENDSPANLGIGPVRIDQPSRRPTARSGREDQAAPGVLRFAVPPEERASPSHKERRKLTDEFVLGQKSPCHLPG
jgi:hypothetical protein